MWSFTLDSTELQLLDTLKHRLRARSRGSILDNAVTLLWKQEIAKTGHRAWCSVPTDGGREDEILRRLHELAMLTGKSMSDIARLAIDQLYTATFNDATFAEELPLVGACK